VNIAAYRQALEQYIEDALAKSDGTHSGISNYLWNLKVSGVFVPNKIEKQKALDDARQAFDAHRNWPVDIILSHLGIKPAQKDNPGSPP
jgi:hypothetical protein